jgi:hypothetical protein
MKPGSDLNVKEESLAQTNIMYNFLILKSVKFPEGPVEGTRERGNEGRE